MAESPERPEESAPTEQTLPASQVEAKKEPTVSAAAAEADQLLGVIRAAAVAAESTRKSAADHATEAELSRKRAVEHEQAVATKLKETSDAASRAGSLATQAEAGAKQAARHSEHIEAAVKHAKASSAAISQVVNEIAAAKERTETISAAAQTTRSDLETLLSALRDQRDGLTPLTDEVESLRTALRDAASEAARAQQSASGKLAEVEQIALDSAAKCKAVSDGEEYIQREREKIAGYSSRAGEQLEAAQGSAANADQAKQMAEDMRDQAQTALGEATQHRDASLEARNRANADAEACAALAKISVEVEHRIGDYEQRLAELKADFDSTKSKILGLLPAATSTGLAAAFHGQRTKYRPSRIFWNLMFFGAIAGLLVIGGIEIAQNWTAGAPSYDQLVRSLVARLPIVAGLLWLGLLAASRSRIAGQIEETYAHMEAVSRSFEGYKREFASLAADTPDGAPVARLCDRVIQAITTPPGHAYETHRKDPTPVSAGVEAAGPILDKLNELAETIAKIKK